MEETERDQHPQNFAYQVPLPQRRIQERRYVMKLSWWQTPLIGYLASLFLMGMATITDIIIAMLELSMRMPTAPFYLAIVVLSWLWGVGPALLGIVLGFFLLDTVIIPPYGIFSFNGWSDVVVYLPLIIIQLLIVLITAQRERAKREALAAARKLAETNQALAHNNDHLEQLNSHLAEVNQLKDYFLSQASHELKTPITAIRGQTQLALRRLAKSQQRVLDPLSLPTHLEKIEEQTRRLQTLIEDLLDISSLNTGKIPLRLAECNLTALCSKVIEDQRVLTDRQIELELPLEPLILRADAQRLTQVIINLLSNAIKYSPKNTVIRVCANHEPSSIILMVHNDGPAIPQEQQMHIFEPFYRTPAAERSFTPGSGLGLAISKEIVERHEGQISVESSQEHGTTFFVCLPLQTSPLD